MEIEKFIAMGAFVISVFIALIAVLRDSMVMLAISFLFLLVSIAFIWMMKIKEEKGEDRRDEK